MDLEVRTWHWGTFLVYCVGCFFAAMALGCMGVPGIIVVALGAGLALWAALQRWFEAPQDPESIFVDRQRGCQR